MKKIYFKKLSKSIFMAFVICVLYTDQSFAQFSLAIDNADDSAYGSGFVDGLNGGFGFDAWAITSGSNTGTFIGDPINDGMSNANIGSNTFGFYATGSEYVNALRSFSGLEINDELSFHWTMNFDANTGSKGFDFKDGATTLFNVNNAGNTDIITSNGSTSSTYGVEAMLVIVKRVSTNEYEFSMTPKDGGATYFTTFNSSSNLNGINIYVGNQNDNAGQRNIYFNNL